MRKFSNVIFLLLALHLFGCSDSSVDVNFKDKFIPANNENENIISPGDQITVSNLEVSEISNTGFTVSVDTSGDENNNSVVTLYYCNETLNPGCIPEVVGSSQVLTDLGGEFSVTLSGLVGPAYNKGDTVNITVITTDAEGVVAGGSFSTSFTLVTVKNIYRSVGYVNTTALASGAGNDLIISGGVATFSMALASRIGLGDAIQFDRSGDGFVDEIIFISGRTSGTEYSVQTINGENPIDLVAPDQDWEIYRAYTSFGGAENGTENAGIDDGLENFDTWTGGKDIVTAEQNWHIVLYADAPYTEDMDIGDWTTGPYNWLKIIVPSDLSHVGSSQRHEGRWREDRALFRLGGAILSVVQSPFVEIDGIQFENSDVQDFNVLEFRNLVSGDEAVIKNNIIRTTGTNVEGNNPYGIFLRSDATFYVYNNIIANISPGLAGSYCFVTFSGPTVYLYNNTMSGCGIGVQSGTSSTIDAKNNIVQNTSISYRTNSSGTYAPTSTNNLSEDGTAPGLNPILNTEVYFNFPEAFDFRLRGNSYFAIGQGVDLSNDSDLDFDTDIMGSVRSRWDVGVSIAPTAIFRSVGPLNTASLENGAGNDLNITLSAEGHTVATFANAVALNIGIGDVIQYDADAAGGVDNLAFISYRIDAQNFIVKNAAGTNAVVTTTASQTWDIFRSYTSSSGAETGVENTGIDDGLEDFDVWTGGRDLSTNNEQWTVAYYADGSSDVRFTVAGWETSEKNHLYYLVPSKINEVGNSQRHLGKWDDEKYIISTSNNDVFTVQIANLFIDGFQVLGPTSGGNDAIKIEDNVGDESLVVLKNSIIKAPPGVGTDVHGVRQLVVSNSDFHFYLFNNIVYGFNNTSCSGVNVFTADSNDRSYFFNNTITGNSAGLSGDWNSNMVIAENNLVVNNTTDYSNLYLLTQNNVSSDATSPDGVGLQGITPIFRNSVGADFRLVNDEANVQNLGSELFSNTYLNVDTDILGYKRKDNIDIGAHESPVTIYRSIGFGATGSLHNGSGNDLAIMSGIANFSSEVFGNIGVGDVIQFDSTNDGSVDALVFIHERIDGSNFRVRNADGSVPADLINPDQDWDIFRAYSSLTDAESGIENSGILAGLNNFDTWTDGKNLQDSGEQWSFALYAGATYDETVAIDGWTPGATRELKFFTPFKSSEVGIRQRHEGVWENRYTSIVPTLVTDNITISVQDNFVNIEGLQISTTTAAVAGVFGIYHQGNTEGVISENLIKDGNTGSAIRMGIFAAGVYGDMYVNNNIIYGFTGALGGGIIASSSEISKLLIYNNTIVNNQDGVVSNNGSNIICKNNISVNNISVDYDSVNATLSDTNIASDASAVGLNQIDNATVNFINSAIEDYRLASVDTTAKNTGLDLSTDQFFPFEEDIVYHNRASGWDIGAFEASTIIPRSVGFGNTSSLANGSGNGLTISGSIASFASVIADNIGIGDVIQFDRSGDGTIDEVMFISLRIDSQNYIVVQADGSSVLDLAGPDEDWDIFRAYTSLNDMRDGVENTGIDDALENFDNLNASRNLHDRLESWKVAVYADSSITSSSSLRTWQTSKDNNLHVFTPYKLTQVGVSQRHNGVWNSDKVNIVMAPIGSPAPLSLAQQHLKVEGFQIEIDPQASLAEGIYVGSDYYTTYIGDNLIKTLSGTSTFSSKGIQIENGFHYVYNNIIFGFQGHVNSSGFAVYGWGVEGAGVVAFNNTLVNNQYGIDGSGGDGPPVLAINNLAQGCVSNCYTGNYLSSSLNNLSSAADTPGSGGIDSATVSFVDAAGEDYRIADDEANAINSGIDLSDSLIFAFATDATGFDRAQWDLGALAAQDYGSFAEFDELGSGTAADPYQIFTKEQILDIGNDIVNGCNASTTAGCGAYFDLKNDIDLVGETYTPIGDCTNAFTGYFDGSDKTISNLTINDYNMECVGLFGKTDGATLENIILSNVDLQGDQFVGGIAGQLTNGTTLQNSSVSGLADTDDVDVGGVVGHINTGVNTVTNVTAQVDVGTRFPYRTSGGFVGYCMDNATITNSAAGGDVFGTREAGGFAGEVIGNCSITNSSAFGNVTGSGATGKTGGFIGNYSGTGVLSNISASGDVSGTISVGGLIGEVIDAGDISNCSATGNISVTDIRGGGLIAYITGAATINNCYALGDVRGSGSYDYAGLIATIVNAGATVSNSWAGGDIHGTLTVGGLVGYNGDATITDSFSLGNVYGTGIRIGGAIARSSGGVITRCYSKGNVYSAFIGDSDAGGFIGAAESDVVISNSYATGNIYGEGNWIGGFVGRSADTSVITQSYATGNVKGSNRTGGFIGYSEAGSISESYATGNVTGNNNTGGFVGFQDANIENSFATGQVFGNDGVGGFAGAISGGTNQFNYSLGNATGLLNTNGFAGTHSGGSASYNYFDLDKAVGLDAVEGVSSSANIYEPLSTPDMQLSSSFSSNWDYTTVWTQNNKYGLPHHKWSPEGICTDNPNVDQFDDLGAGTAANPYIICNKEQVEDMDSCTSCTSHFVLGADIDLQNTGDNDGIVSNPDSIVFDGRDHRIFNYLNEEIFDSSNLTSTIKNLNIINVNKTGGDGDLVGGEDDTFLNVNVIGKSQTTDGFVGGISYSSDGIFHSTNVIANINSGSGSTGGFVGYGTPLIYRSSFIGDILSTGGNVNLGIFVGQSRTAATTIFKSFGAGSITGDSGQINGFIGRSDGSVYESINSVDVNTADSNVEDAFGFNGNVYNSYNIGNINTPNLDGSGGLTNDSAVNSYFQGTVVAADNISGIGTNSGITSGTFWDTDISGEDDCARNGSLSTVGVCEGKTTAEMDDDTTYTGAGWDTTNIWLLRNNVSAPLLRWNIHPACYANATASAYNDIGTGGVNDPYLICFKEQLIDLATNGCSTLTSTLGCDDYYQLMNDIDLKGEVFAPIGYGTSFTGVFEGNGNRIINMTITGGANNYQGMFTSIDGAEIYNLNLVKVDVSSTGTQIGGLSGEAIESMVKNVIVTGTVTGGTETGGVIGATVTTTELGFLNNIMFYGDVSSVSGNQIGGLVGRLSGSVYLENSYAAGSVSSGGTRIGGLVGNTGTGASGGGEILGNSASSVVTGNVKVGGLAGSSYIYVANNFSYGEVINSSVESGGLLGICFGQAVNNFSKTQVNTPAGVHGGIIGNLQGFASRNYSFGTLAGGATTGGIGLIAGTAENNYYDSDESGDASQDVSGEVEPLITTEIRDPLNLVDWDFSDTWKDINGEHPTHKSGFLQSHSSFRRPAAIVEGEEYLDTTGLVALFHFDESPADESTNFTMADDTATPTDGTLITGDTTADKSTTGLLDGALDFDGVDDYVTLGDPVETQLTGAMTVMAWIYVDTTSNFYIVTKMGSLSNIGYDLSANISGADFNLEFRIGENATTILSSGVSQDFSVGSWYHVVGVFRPSTSVEIWVNGSLENINTTAIPATQNNSTSNVEIGTRTADASFFDGVMDEVSIWSRALSAFEINDIYTRQRPK